MSLGSSPKCMFLTHDSNENSIHLCWRWVTGILAAYSTALELCPGLRLSCFVMFRLALRFNTYSPGLLHWCGGNRTIAPMPVKQPWTQKRKGRQGDCSGRHWGRWSLPSTSPVMNRAVTLTTFPVKWILKVSTSNKTTSSSSSSKFYFQQNTTITQ